MLYDVVIIGGGAVGASLALMFAQENFQVLLIEKKAASTKLIPDKEARTIALSFASTHILEALGIWQSLQHRSVPIQEVRVSVAGRLGTTRLDAKEQKVPFLGQVVSFDELERTVFEALAHLPNVKIMRPATLQHYQLSSQGWDLSIAEEEKILPIKTRLLVAADGIDSMLRKALAIAVNKTEYGHFAVMSNIERSEVDSFTAFERFMAQGAMALLPWRNQMATCVMTAPMEQAQSWMAMSDQEYLTTCQDLLGRRQGRLIGLGKRICLPLTMQIATQQMSHRFLLMGNAAHSLHPIAAQGLNLSLRDIWQLRHQIRMSKMPIDVGSPHFLETYIKARANDQSRIIFATDKIAKYMSGGPLPMKLRALGITLFDSFMPAKKMFTRISMGLM
ncbi:FAD-dependent oxidoreductase [Candidatus Berkiella aquae]|uniref:2-octaprenyl-6-methoxyphenol hydroxylase n=1 Tax=Candidatus Berkiella aquae TaxID=295108 RepID=A0A0Q9YQP7_9GAMM|nr:FAD-dependent oxidoreductase [Candidatus Berkiella aquae]MCS5712566.1 FAD-dependent monooxygenase [Candidatus Berkiella aquae]